MPQPTVYRVIKKCKYVDFWKGFSILFGALYIRSNEKSNFLQLIYLWHHIQTIHKNVLPNQFWPRGATLYSNHYFIGFMLPGLWPLVETFYSPYHVSTILRYVGDWLWSWFAICSHFDMVVRWPPRPTLASGLFWWVCLNISKNAPKPSTKMSFPPNSGHWGLLYTQIIISLVSWFLASGL